MQASALGVAGIAVGSAVSAVTVSVGEAVGVATAGVSEAVGRAVEVAAGRGVRDGRWVWVGCGLPVAEGEAVGLPVVRRISGAVTAEQAIRASASSAGISAFLIEAFASDKRVSLHAGAC